MTKKQRQTFLECSPPNLHEWDAVLNEESTIKELKVIVAKTLVLSSSNTRRILRIIVELLSIAWHIGI